MLLLGSAELAQLLDEIALGGLSDSMLRFDGLLLETSVWNFVIFVISTSVIGLWLYSAYLEWDQNFVLFSLKLISFIFSVWLVISSAAGFVLLLGWEIVGFVSLNLIGTWASRSFSSSSAFSAVGFNRIGDVVLLVLIGACGLNSAFSHSQFWLVLWILVFSLKSVFILTYLWLPEAMEGPTPVSSLLHSCTLVMAGIFAFWSSAIATPIWLVLLFTFSVVFVSLASRAENDLKRNVAFSTVLMVGLCWVAIALSTSISALLICIFHAAYKSLTFLSIGRILTLISTYSDHAGLPTSFFGSVVPVSIFLIGLRGSAYSGVKHNLDLANSVGFSDLVLRFFVLYGFLVLWLLGIKLLSNSKSLIGFSPNDFAIMGLSISVFLLHFSILSVSSSSVLPSSTALLLVMVLATAHTRSFGNIGSVCFSTGFHNPFLVKYSILSHLFAFRLWERLSPVSLAATSLALLAVSVCHGQLSWQTTTISDNNPKSIQLSEHFVGEPCCKS